jgi:hypothetical protein
MNILISKTDDMQADRGRRSFIWKIGAGISAVAAAAAPAAIGKAVIIDDKGLIGRVNSLSRQVAVMENEKKIRQLYKNYNALLDKGMYRDVLALFSKDAEVVFNGGLYRGRDTGINRLYCKYFSMGMTGRQAGFAPGLTPDAEAQKEIIEFAPDLKSAKARFPYSIQAAHPMDMESSLVRMARLQGEGFIKYREGGVCELSFVNDDGDWKIERLEYRAVSRADYRPYSKDASPVTVPKFTKLYPQESFGPDKLIKSA